MADDTLRPADEARESKVDVDQGAPTSPNGEAHGDARDAETDTPKKTRSRVKTVDLTTGGLSADEKPKPRTRKKAEPDTEAPEADEKPKRRTRKKTEPDASGDSASGDASDSSDGASGGDAQGEAPPRRKRTRRKVEDKPVASSDDPAVAEASGDDRESESRENDDRQDDDARSRRSRGDTDRQGGEASGDGNRSRGNRGDDRQNDHRQQNNDDGGSRRGRRRKKKSSGGGTDSGGGHPGQEFEGILELIGDKKFGFIREFKTSLQKGDNDPFMPPPLIQKHNLRDGVKLSGVIKPGRKGAWQVTHIESIMDEPPEAWDETEDFDAGMVIYPEEKLNLISGPSDASMRVIDLVSPLGKGQRALIVAPPRAGKTILLKKMAEGLAQNHPGIKLIALLIDERPEEVTDFRRNTDATVFASSNDYGEDNHVRVATLAFEYSRRLVEQGHDVVVLLDSLTRLGRTFNLWGGNSGRTMSGGLDARALLMPRKIFSSARNIEGGGSLTIIATALVETGSRMDDVIFEEFKGTGNAEIVLDRELSEKRIYPAINIRKSGTRNEERLVAEEHVAQRHLLLRALNSRHPVEAMQALLKQIQLSPTNVHLLNELIPEQSY